MLDRLPRREAYGHWTPNAAAQKPPNRRLSSQQALGPSFNPAKSAKCLEEPALGCV